MACVLGAGAHARPVGLVEMSYFSGLCCMFTKLLERVDLYLLFRLFLSCLPSSLLLTEQCSKFTFVSDLSVSLWSERVGRCSKQCGLPPVQ